MSDHYGVEWNKDNISFRYFETLLGRKSEGANGGKAKKNTKGWSIKKAGDNLRLFMFYWL